MSMFSTECWSPEQFIVVVQSLSHVWLFATPWTAAHQASLSFTTSRRLRQEIKGIHIGKKEVKWSLFPTTWSYISKTQKISQKESLRLIKFRGCRIQKSTLKNQAAFPYTNKEHMERKLINNSTYNTIKKNKILRDKLNQAMRQKTYILKTKKHCWEKLKKIQANGKTSHVQEL